MEQITLGQVIGATEFLIEDMENLSKTLKCRELSLALTRIEEAQMWLEKLKKRLPEE